MFEVTPQVNAIAPEDTHPEVVYDLNWQPEVLPSTGEKLEIVVNHERVHDVLSTLMEAYESKEFPYGLDSVRLPHDPRHMPQSLPYGGPEHAMFLWNLCYYMRGGIKSVEAVKRLAKVYEARPDLFRCDVAAQAEQSEIIDALKAAGLGFQETVSRQWKENSRRLQEEWGGDPRNLFEGVNSYDEALSRIKNDQRGGGFSGFQEKMTSMITYYLMDEGLIKHFVFPIPVDLHVMRVSIANQMVEFPGVPEGTNLYTDELLATLRKLYYDYAIEHDIDPLRLCDAVWLLSESLCGKHPGNVTLEPEGRKKRKGRSTVLIPQPVDPANPAQQAAYESSCRNCPIERTCTYNIPGKLYYISGVIIIRGTRYRFPPPAQGSLF